MSAPDHASSQIHMFFSSIDFSKLDNSTPSRHTTSPARLVPNLFAVDTATLSLDQIRPLYGAYLVFHGLTHLQRSVTAAECSPEMLPFLVSRLLRPGGHSSSVTAAESTPTPPELAKLASVFSTAVRISSLASTSQNELGAPP